ncbi:MAG TPA: hypothetical protein VM802_19735 [Chitinophaga sp.]|uniref:hypothetical protein n=1 Tax=Chitinophaga sp. TaxID=1869181 RepID=UPI002CAEE2AB|nr:hypothetical protein [Chitinophaga sp.]HVI47118.1 hypothetical protein [Chitinophaga sp.]
MQKINPTSRIWIRRILIIALFVVTESRYASGQCNWGFTTTIQPSVCAASGKITITLTGANAGTLTNLLYSLEPVVQGGFAIAPNSSPLLENIPPGQYKVRVQAVCGSEQVSSLQDVQVRGNYVPFKAVLSQKRQALNGCNTGQASLLLTPGKAPFT